MYNRARDFVDFDNSNKNYWNSTRYEVYGFFDPEKQVWMHELIDHNAFDLRYLNTGCGEVIQSSANTKLDMNTFESFLQGRYPNAIVAMYETMYEWQQDIADRCFR